MSRSPPEAPEPSEDISAEAWSSINVPGHWLVRTRGKGISAKDRGVHEIGPFGIGLQGQLFGRRAHGVLGPSQTPTSFSLTIWYKGRRVAKLAPTQSTTLELRLSYRFYGPGGKRVVGMYARHGVTPGSPTIPAGLSEP
jgi:hypothetical protein